MAIYFAARKINRLLQNCFNVLIVLMAVLKYDKIHPLVRFGDPGF